MQYVPLERLFDLIKQYSTTFKNRSSVMLGVYFNKDKIKYVLINGQTIYLTPKEAVLLLGIRIIELAGDIVKFSFNAE